MTATNFTRMLKRRATAPAKKLKLQCLGGPFAYGYIWLTSDKTADLVISKQYGLYKRVDNKKAVWIPK